MNATPFAITEAPSLQVTTMLSAKLAASGSNLTTIKLGPSQVLSIKTARPSSSKERRTIESGTNMEGMRTVCLVGERKTNARRSDRPWEIDKFHKN